MDPLRKLFQSLIPLSNEEYDALASMMYVRKYKKGEIIVNEGEVCHFFAFIMEGAVRSYFIKKDIEYTKFVLLKNNFVTALSSYVENKPSREIIQAIPYTKLICIDRQALELLCKDFPVFEKALRRFIEISHLRVERRLIAFISMTAEERYRALAIEQPEIIQKIPLQYVASLIGIQPETLSRIRKKMSSSETSH